MWRRTSAWIRKGTAQAGRSLTPPLLRQIVREIRAGWYDGAREDRTTSFRPVPIGPNAAIKMDAAFLRSRARWLVDSTPHAWAALDAILSNVIECGIIPVPVGLAEGKEEVRTAWREWGGLTPLHLDKPCDVTGQVTIYELSRLWLSEVVKGGGCLLHFAEVDRSGRTGAARIPLVIDLLPEERFADDADTYTGLNPKTRTIHQGIEFDPATGRPLAYWVKRGMPADGLDYDPAPLRLPADQCVYAFLRGNLGPQRRGVTALAPIVQRVFGVDDIVGNQVVASQMKTQWGYVRTRPKDEEGYEEQDSLEDGFERYDEHGNPLRTLGRGLVYETDPGCDIKGIFPTMPLGDEIAWLEWIERTIGFGVGISRLALTRDASDANHSSLRAAKQEDQRRFKIWQEFCANHFTNPVWHQFSKAAVRIGLPGFPSPAAFLANPEPLLHVTCRAPGWLSVDPLADAKANEINVGLGIHSRAEIKAADGGEKDIADTFEELASEEELADGRFPIHGFQTSAQESAAEQQADQAANERAPAKKTAKQSGGSR